MLPSAQQREATARRFQGHGALTDSVVNEPQIVDPVSPQRPPPKSWFQGMSFCKQLSLVVMLSALAAGVLGNALAKHVVVFSMGSASEGDRSQFTIWGIGWVVFFVWPFVMVMYCYLRSFNKIMDVAMEPLPSLAEIDAQLRAEGYEPSIADCVALHQYLTSQRNEAAAVAAGIVIGSQVLARQAQGKPLL